MIRRASIELGERVSTYPARRVSMVLPRSTREPASSRPLSSADETEIPGPALPIQRRQRTALIRRFMACGGFARQRLAIANDRRSPEKATSGVRNTVPAAPRSNTGSVMIERQEKAPLPRRSATPPRGIRTEGFALSTHSDGVTRVKGRPSCSPCRGRPAASPRAAKAPP